MEPMASRLSPSQLQQVFAEMRSHNVSSVYIDSLKDHLLAQDQEITRLASPPVYLKPASKSYLRLSRGAHYDLTFIDQAGQEPGPAGMPKESLNDAEFLGENEDGSYVFVAEGQSWPISPFSVIHAEPTVPAPSLP